MPLYKFTIYGASVFYVSCAAAVRTPSFTLEALEIKSNTKQKNLMYQRYVRFFVFRRCIRRHKKATCSDRNRDLSNHSTLVSGLGACWIPFRVACRPQLPGCRVVRQSCVLVRVSSRADSLLSGRKRYRTILFLREKSLSFEVCFPGVA